MKKLPKGKKTYIPREGGSRVINPDKKSSDKKESDDKSGDIKDAG